MLYLMIALGGSAGALTRFVVSAFINNLASASFPIGTLFLNVTGSFIIGFLFQVYQSVLVTDEMKMFLTVGFLGSYTTFSTYSLETLNLLLAHEYKSAFLNIAISNILAVSMTLLGMLAARIILLKIRQGV
jgi:fluoride exporter